MQIGTSQAVAAATIEDTGVSITQAVTSDRIEVMRKLYIRITIIVKLNIAQ